MKEVHVKYYNDKYEHNYNIIEKEEPQGMVSVLSRSNNNEWTEEAKGKNVTTITDNGEGLLIESDDPQCSYSIALDYASAEELFILMTQQDFAPFQIKETKTTMQWPLSQ
jgi:hypothetical protein